MAPTTEDLFKAFLSEVRGDVSLPTPVIKHLVKYYLETAELLPPRHRHRHSMRAALLLAATTVVANAGSSWRSDGAML